MVMMARVSKTFVWCTLAAWIIATTAPLVAPHTLVDIDCGDAVIAASSEQSPRLRAAPSEDSAEDDHCLICHFQRNLRGACAGSTALGQSFNVLPHAIDRVAPSPRPAARFDSPSRAPPVPTA